MTPGGGAGDRRYEAAQRLGQLRSRRGPQVADALRNSRACRAGGLLVARADLAFYGRDVIAAIGRAGARFSITAARKGGAPRDQRDRRGHVDDDPLPHAVFNEQLRQWVSDAEVAEVPFTAFASRGKKDAVTAWLIMRRVRD